VELEDALVGAVRSLNRRREELPEIALGVTPFREDDDAAVGPFQVLAFGVGAAELDRGALVLANPVEKGEDLGVGGAAVLFGEAQELVQELSRFGLWRRERFRGALNGLGVGLLLGIVVDSVLVVFGEEGGFPGKWRCGRCLSDASRVGLESPVERLEAAEKALLEVDEDELGFSRLTGLGLDEVPVLAELF
jgi:hypothetical protein